MKNKGFTLIELLAVVTILGLIVLIAVPSTVNVLEKNKKESFINDAKKIMRLVETEDRRNDYKNKIFVINSKKTMGTVTRDPSYPYDMKYYYNYMTVGDIQVSPYNNKYKILMIYACTTPNTYGSIRYYRIYMNDGKKQLRAVKGLPENFFSNTILSYGTGNEPYNLTDTTVTRYKIVEKIQGNINSYIGCYNFK